MEFIIQGNIDTTAALEKASKVDIWQTVPNFSWNFSLFFCVCSTLTLQSLKKCPLSSFTATRDYRSCTRMRHCCVAEMTEIYIWHLIGQQQTRSRTGLLKILDGEKSHLVLTGFSLSLPLLIGLTVNYDSSSIFTPQNDTLKENLNCQLTWETK